MADSESERKINNLKQEWEAFLKIIVVTTPTEEYKAFHKWTHQLGNAEINLVELPDDFLQANKENINKLTLERYTDLLNNKNEQNPYFTNWVERKTENCGKFRTASSYAYGVYRVNEAGEFYRTVEHRKDKKNIDKNNVNTFFENNIRPVIVGLANFYHVGTNNNPGNNEPENVEVNNAIAFIDPDKLKYIDINYARKVAYLFNPDKLLPIYKKDVIGAIAKFFGIDGLEYESYKVTEKILSYFKDNKWFPESSFTNGNWASTEHAFQDTQKVMKFLWEYFGKSFSFEQTNIIYHGAPGTGKTYTVTEGIKQSILLNGDNENDVYEFAQFHPSYGYEEFIDGMKPTSINGGNIQLALVNGNFKIFCIKAFNNLIDVHKSKDNENHKIIKKNYYFVADEINRAELSRVFGEVLVCIEEDKRLKIDDTGKVLGTKVKTQNASLWEKKHAVAVLDDNDQINDCGKNFYFGIPENLYFIGTMNDIDRSVDSFDMALRRRFYWEYCECDYGVIEEHFSKQKNNDVAGAIKNYKENCQKLNEHIIGSNGFNLGESYQLGHAYFMKHKKIDDSQLETTWENHIAPLLKEYLRAEFSEKDIKQKLEEAKKIFIPESNAQ